MTTNVKITAAQHPVEIIVRDRYVTSDDSGAPAERGVPGPDGGLIVQRTEQVSSTVTTETITTIVLLPGNVYDAVATDTRSIVGIRELHPTC